MWARKNTNGPVSEFFTKTVYAQVMNFIPVKVSILYNMYNGDRAIGEASLEPTHRLGYL
jgi:hypothetical protein